MQVTPSLWTVWRTARPTGVARGTWLLVLGELTCWAGYGLYRDDPRLIALGCTGVTAATLMLLRLHLAGTLTGLDRQVSRHGGPA